MSEPPPFRFEIRGQGADSNIHEDVEVGGDESYAFAFMDGYLAAKFGDTWEWDVGGPDREGETLVYWVTIWHK